MLSANQRDLQLSFFLLFLNSVVHISTYTEKLNQLCSSPLIKIFIHTVHNEIQCVHTLKGAHTLIQCQKRHQHAHIHTHRHTHTHTRQVWTLHFHPHPMLTVYSLLTIMPLQQLITCVFCFTLQPTIVKT